MTNMIYYHLRGILIEDLVVLVITKPRFPI